MATEARSVAITTWRIALRCREAGAILHRLYKLSATSERHKACPFEPGYGPIEPGYGPVEPGYGPYRRRFNRMYNGPFELDFDMMDDEPLEPGSAAAWGVGSAAAWGPGYNYAVRYNRMMGE